MGRQLPEIIDAHTHLSGRREDILNLYAQRNGLNYTLDELLRLMQEYGVSRSLLLSPIVGNRPLPNEDIIGFCEKSHGKLRPIVTVEPRPKRVLAAVRLAERRVDFVRGFKVLLGYERVFADDSVLNPVYDFAESNGLPIMFHTGDTADANASLKHAHPLTLDSLANKRNGLKIVACHFGNPWFDDVAELIYKHENVYADISGLTVGGSKYQERYGEWLANRISKAIYYSAGGDKVIFGTDYPVTTLALTLSLVDRLEIDPGDRRKILAENAKGVFNI